MRGNPDDRGNISPSTWNVEFRLTRQISIPGRVGTNRQRNRFLWD
jgi:hypothetical protein